MFWTGYIYFSTFIWFHCDLSGFQLWNEAFWNSEYLHCRLGLGFVFGFFDCFQAVKSGSLLALTGPICYLIAGGLLLSTSFTSNERGVGIALQKGGDLGSLSISCVPYWITACSDLLDSKSQKIFTIYGAVPGKCSMGMNFSVCVASHWEVQLLALWCQIAS